MWSEGLLFVSYDTSTGSRGGSQTGVVVHILVVGEGRA